MKIPRLRLKEHAPVSVTTLRSSDTSAADLMRHIRQVENEERAKQWGREQRKQRKRSI